MKIHEDISIWDVFFLYLSLSRSLSIVVQFDLNSPHLILFSKTTLDEIEKKKKKTSNKRIGTDTVEI